MATSNPASARTRGAAAAKGVPLTRARTSPSAPRRRPQEPVASRGRHRLRNSPRPAQEPRPRWWGSKMRSRSATRARARRYERRFAGSQRQARAPSAPERSRSGIRAPSVPRSGSIDSSSDASCQQLIRDCGGKAESFGVRPPDELAICNKSDPGPGSQTAQRSRRGRTRRTRPSTRATASCAAPSRRRGAAQRRSR
jgi:hypothetical protein